MIVIGGPSNGLTITSDRTAYSNNAAGKHRNSMQTSREHANMPLITTLPVVSDTVYCRGYNAIVKHMHN